MPKTIIPAILCTSLLISCVDLNTNTQDAVKPNAPLFVTSTLPPTKQALTIPTQSPPTITPTSESSSTTGNDSTTPSCRDSAILVEDVTYPDDTSVDPGETFTKTWKLQNAGTCTWTGYRIAFVDGDRMNSPDTISVAETQRSQAVEVSVDLTAPEQNGTFRGNFELLNSNGVTVKMGTDSIFWVQIIVGTGGIPNSSGTPITFQSGNCTYTTNDGYVQQLINLINQSRADVGRAELSVNDILMKTAQAHSLDMACNNFLNHSGSNGSWVGDRLKNAGYPNSYYLELLAIGLPQDAINQWKVHPKLEWDLVINSRVIEIGVGYVYSKFSSYGGYWTVNMGGP